MCWGIYLVTVILMSDIHKLLHTIVTVKAIFHPFCLITGTFWFFIILSFRFVICGWCEFAVFLGLASYVDFLSTDLIWCLRVSAGPRGIGGGGVLWAGSMALRARAPRFPRFILLVSFNDTLLVVSILDILWLPFVAAFAALRGLLIVPVGTMSPF